jgi:hypothetical protein
MDSFVILTASVSPSPLGPGQKAGGALALAPAGVPTIGTCTEFSDRDTERTATEQVPSTVPGWYVLAGRSARPHNDEVITSSMPRRRRSVGLAATAGEGPQKHMRCDPIGVRCVRCG